MNQRKRTSITEVLIIRQSITHPYRFKATEKREREFLLIDQSLLIDSVKNTDSQVRRER